jgi:hypothetical protein
MPICRAVNGVLLSLTLLCIPFILWAGKKFVLSRSQGKAVFLLLLYGFVYSGVLLVLAKIFERFLCPLQIVEGALLYITVVTILLKPKSNHSTF